MNIETLRDVLHWTREFHIQLNQRYFDRPISSGSSKVRLLQAYLSEHQYRLIRVLDKFEYMASLNKLNNWCYEFVDRKPIISQTDCDKPVEAMNLDEVIAEVIDLHSQFVMLYRHLVARSNIKSADKLLRDLKGIENHEFALIVSPVFLQEQAS